MGKGGVERGEFGKPGKGSGDTVGIVGKGERTREKGENEKRRKKVVLMWQRPIMLNVLIFFAFRNVEHVSVQPCHHSSSGGECTYL